MVKRKRPFGVTIIALVQALSAPTTGFSVLTGPLAFSVVHGNVDFDLEAIIVTILGLVIAVGLWRLKRWAWVAAMLWTGTTLANALLLYFRGHPNFPLMIEGILIVFYLNQRDVQLAFGEVPAPSGVEG